VGNTCVQTARDIAQTDVSAASGMASIYGNAANGYLNNSIYGQAKQNALQQPGTVTIGRAGSGGNPSYETLFGRWSGG
jgi:hypothetical protein